MKKFKDFILEMGAGAVGGGPTNVTGVNVSTDPATAGSVDADRKRRKRKLSNVIARK
jgi:hypothetical protein